MEKEKNIISLLFISDTHGKHSEITGAINNITNKVDGVDILIHCGDISNIGKQNQIQDFLDWFSALPEVKHKVFIAGNHDLSLDPKNFWYNEIHKYDKAENVHYLMNQSVKLEGLNIYGSPVTPRFYDWAFMKRRGTEIRTTWEDIPRQTDILITHGPPFGVGDKTIGGVITGCQDLLNTVNESHIALHAFGHIHEGYGVYKMDPDWSNWPTPTHFINASVLNHRYEISNQPILVYIDNITKDVNVVKYY